MMKRLIAVFLLGFPIWADSVQLPWNAVCKEAGDHEIAISTSNGETVYGYCVTVKLTEMSVRTKDNLVTVAKDSITRMMVTRKNHPIEKLGRGLLVGFHYGFNALLSPAAPIGLITIPAVVAWAAVATPFCLIGEIRDNEISNREIVIQ